MLLEYVVLVVVLAVVGMRVASLVEEKIDRKIVIWLTMLSMSAIVEFDN